jgi:trimethylamine--corrinoid protein Co-methyltransferase
VGRLRAQVSVLSEREIKRVHRASLSILGEIGVQVPNEHLLSRLRAAGAAVDGERVYLPEALVVRALESSSRRHRGRSKRRKSPLQVTNGCETTIIDYPEHRRRPGTLEDVLKGIVLTNALPNVGSALPVVVPSDVPSRLAPVEAYRLGCLYSAKPFNVYFGLEQAAYLMDMAAIAADAKAISRRDLGFSFGFGIISPLRFAPNDLECALRVAADGWPVGCYSFVTLGATAPASMAGALALSNAERLACLVLMWLLESAGADTGRFSGDPCIVEPRSLSVSFGHPNLTILAVAMTQLSRFYGIGSEGGGLALTDAKLMDYQNGFERGLGAVVCVLAGSSIGNAGILGADEAFSFEQLVLDDASISAINWLCRGIEVTEESLGLEAIREVGVGGTYLVHPHTAKYLRREFWDSPLFTRSSWLDWERQGQAAAAERAHQEVERILAQGYPPRPLVSAAVSARLEQVLQRAYEDLG